MTRLTKERLLGFIVLLAAASIFLPMLFDGEGIRQGKLQAVIPEPPKAEPITHFQPQTQPHEDTSELAEPVVASAAELSPPPKPLPRSSVVTSAKVATKAKAVKTAAQPVTKSKKPAAKPRSSNIGKEKPVLDKQGVPTGWTLQLASFKSRTNAVALQQRLIKLGYKSYIREKGDLNKVFVGPDVQKTIIEKQKRELKKKLKLDGLILRFKP